MFISLVLSLYSTEKSLAQLLYSRLLGMNTHWEEPAQTLSSWGSTVPSSSASEKHPKTLSKLMSLYIKGIHWLRTYESKGLVPLDIFKPKCFEEMFHSEFKSILTCNPIGDQNSAQTASREAHWFINLAHYISVSSCASLYLKESWGEERGETEKKESVKQFENLVLFPKE